LSTLKTVIYHLVLRDNMCFVDTKL